MLSLRSALLWVLAAAPLVSAQLSGTVGPLTSRASKAATKVCNIMSYGGKASATTDNAAAISSAWAACKSGGQVYIPSGSYGLGTYITLSGGSKVSFNLEGTIYRILGTPGTTSDNMIIIKDTDDFEFYSATSKGAIQGYGYEYHKASKYGPRILRLTDVTNFSVHDIALVDAPSFHLCIVTCTNGDIYNIIARGANEGGTDGIDVKGTNIYVHDVEVSNKDECVTIKSPSKNIFVENIFCNWSGGCALGSLVADTDVSYIKYNNIYTHHGNQMLMIKSNGGSGTCSNSVFTNFIGHSNAYTLDLDSAWSSMDTVAGDGVNYKNLTFTGWKGTAANGASRGPINVKCPAKVPCTGLTISDFNVWTDDGSEVLWKCSNAFGSGGCLKSGSTSTYASTSTLTTVAGYSITTMPGELTAGLGVTVSITIPPLPTTFFPGQKPKSVLLNGSA